MNVKQIDDNRQNKNFFFLIRSKQKHNKNLIEYLLTSAQMREVTGAKLQALLAYPQKIS